VYLNIWPTWFKNRGYLPDFFFPFSSFITGFSFKKILCSHLVVGLLLPGHQP
jgi:hypothetical protein